MTDTLTPEFVEELSHFVEGYSVPGDYLVGIRLKLDLAGYDVSDPAFVESAWRQALQVVRKRRARFGALGQFRALMLTDKEIGEKIGMPKSTVQAVATGRVVERFTAAQKKAFQNLIVEFVEECRSVLDALG